MYRISLMMIVIGVISGCLYSKDSEIIDIFSYCQNISNEDIIWDGDYIGLTPKITSENSIKILKSDDEK